MVQTLRDEQIRFMTASLLVLAAVATAFALQYTSGFMIPFVLAVFITTMVSPLVDYQVEHRVPRVLAIASTVLIVLLALGLMVYFTVLAVQAIISTAEEYSLNFANMSDLVFRWLEKLHIDVQKEDIAIKVREALISLAPHTASIGFGVLSNAMAIALFAIFLLAGRPTGVSHTGIYAEMEAKIRNYVTMKIMLSAVTGVLVAVLLAILGLRMATVFGILAFFLNFVPSIGSVIATVLPLPIAVAQFSNPVMWVLVVLLPGGVQLGIGNGLEPKLMGEGMKLHPVVVLLALAFWGLLWGVIGMVLSVPLTATLRIILMQFDTTRPIGNLLAGELPQLEVTD